MALVRPIRVCNSILLQRIAAAAQGCAGNTMQVLPAAIGQQPAACLAMERRASTSAEEVRRGGVI